MLFRSGFVAAAVAARDSAAEDSIDNMGKLLSDMVAAGEQIGRASCRERV